MSEPTPPQGGAAVAPPIKPPFTLAAAIWEFDDAGLMRRRHASINDVQIREADRKYRWAAPGPRPKDHPGLSDLGL